MLVHESFELNEPMHAPRASQRVARWRWSFVASFAVCDGLKERKAAVSACRLTRFSGDQIRCCACLGAARCALIGPAVNTGSPFRQAGSGTGHSPRALRFPQSRHWNDLSRYGRTRVEISLATQSGNFNSCSIALNHGSLRTGSRNGSVFSHVRPGSCTRTAVASHSRALPLSPHCA